ncbi:DNA-binding protein [Williamsoniiplasma somnilux]|uniref:UPF0122 protein ESOMN_v1c02320 n=1 Tax=Williamsoniiplasma somnilux TaxID=215578 RepID=A0A2K8NYI7_9MOLU|nr:sigma factor-like helix-turn-helix DNA-binding protein [Williamsoniiplasma somnilux]ATZ18616.1 DNA-binding protein [Williamsoniiplasma somnilux]
MTNIEKTLELSNLFLIYKNLLTEKQKLYFELYVDEDLSLQEIAEEFGISRAAVHDSITKTSEAIYNFESKLKLKSKKDRLNQIISYYKNSSNSETQELIRKLEEE